MPMVPAGVSGKWQGRTKKNGKAGFRWVSKGGKAMARRSGKVKAGFRRAYEAQTKADFAQVARITRMKGVKRAAAKNAIIRRRKRRAA